MLNSKYKDILKTLFLNKEYDKTINMAKKLSEECNDDGFLANIIGASYSAIGMVEDAIKYLNISIELDDRSIKPHISLAMLYSRMGNRYESIKSYKRVIEIDPSHIYTLQQLVMLYIHTDSIDNAISTLERLIEIDSATISNYINLANLLSQIDMDMKAIDIYKNALKIDPENPILYYNFGHTMQKIGRDKDAMDLYSRSLEFDPNNINTIYNIAYILEKNGDLNSAFAHYQKILKLDPKNVETLNSLGDILKKWYRYDESLYCYGEAIKIDPKYTRAYNNAGILLMEIGDFDKASNLFDQLLSINPGPKGYYNKALLYKNISQYDNAIKFYEKAITLKKDYKEAYLALASLYKEQNDRKKAIELYQKAIKIDPNYTEAYFSLATIRKYKKDGNTYIKEMLSVLDNSKTLSDKKYINFALAKVYDDIEDINRSYSYLKEANIFQLQENKYNIEDQKRVISNIKSLFSNDIDTLKTSEDREPIFIVGMPRSGTTLVEQIISSHSSVYGAGELEFITQIVGNILNSLSSKENINIDKDILSDIRNRYMERVDRLNFTEKIFTDKMPHNFIYIGFILSAFPNAKIVHLERDPMAVCWSMYKLNFPAQDLGYSNDFDTLAEFYYMHEDMMKFWREIYPNKIYDISYEKLTTNQEDESRNLLEYCGLKWEDRCLEFHKNSRVVKTASSLQIRESMYQGSSQAWEKYKEYLQPLIERLEFEAHKRGKSLNPNYASFMISNA